RATDPDDEDDRHDGPRRDRRHAPRAAAGPAPPRGPRLRPAAALAGGRPGRRTGRRGGWGALTRDDPPGTGREENPRKAAGSLSLRLGRVGGDGEPGVAGGTLVLALHGRVMSDQRIERTIVVRPQDDGGALVESRPQEVFLSPAPE